MDTNSGRHLKTFAQLLCVIGILALTETIHASVYYYSHLRWQALGLEAAKTLLLLMVIGIGLFKRFSKDEAVPNLTSVQLGMLALMISAVADMQQVYFRS